MGGTAIKPAHPDVRLRRRELHRLYDLLGRKPALGRLAAYVDLEQDVLRQAQLFRPPVYELYELGAVHGLDEVRDADEIFYLVLLKVGR